MEILMKHTALSCCYFPTNVVFVDDNENFLNNVTLGLSLDLTYRKFSSISQFNQFLAKAPSQLTNNRWSRSAEDLTNTVTHGQHEIAINFHLLYEQIYNLDRYNEISVIVVDYAMPKCNGIDLCKAIRKSNPHIKTLLLTGEADHHLAVKAFNSNLIDKFLLKENIKEFTHILDNAIHELAQAYFCRTLEALSINLTGENPLLKHESFLELFNSVYESHKACEYYLVDASGGYLMLNKQGEAKWLIVKNDDDVRSYCELAEGEEELDDPDLKKLAEKTLLPFYHGEYLNIPITDWESHLLPAKKLVIKKIAYPYGIDTGFKNSIIDPQKIHGYGEYRAATK
jgi:CheY-like chemotaxis protein